jgi:uncharacterized membrane protein (UPF0182 family)
MTDYADNEVKGIARYIPTNLSKAILLLIPGALWIVFSAIREHTDWFGLEAWTSLEKTLLAALIACFIGIFLVIVLVVDMAVAIHHSKHRRIVHYSNEHPLMSIKFLATNATVRHYFMLGVIFLVFFIAGYYFRAVFGVSP